MIGGLFVIMSFNGMGYIEFQESAAVDVSEN